MASLIAKAFAITFLALVSSAANAATKHSITPVKAVHRLLIQVDQNDPEIMNLALNNATNVIEYYRARGERANIDVVAFGPGLHMLRSDTSPVKDRIKSMKEKAALGMLHFSACSVTKRGMESKEGRPIAVLPEVSTVSSGIIHIMEQQEKGWSYVRP